MLEKLNAFLQKYIAILTPLSLILGVLLESVGQNLLFLVSWLCFHNIRRKFKYEI